MIKTLKIENGIHLRLDKYLKLKFSALTQSFIEKNIRKKNILINNVKTKSNYIVKANDKLKILNFHTDQYKNKIIYKKILKIPNKFIKLFNKSIISENEEFLILNKWASIASQGGSKINISIDDIIKHISPEYKLVHRLDKNTTGLLIISKKLSAAKVFGNLFKSKLISKTYLAICEGVPKLRESNVNLDIKDKFNKINITNTYYRVLNYKKGLSLILFKPITGKTHQLRIVSKNLGAPIVGDIKYNKSSKFINDDLKLNAFNLKFTFNKKQYEYFSYLPKDFEFFLKKYKLNNPIKLKEQIKN